MLLEDDKGEFQGLAYENFPVVNTAFFDAPAAGLRRDARHGERRCSPRRRSSELNAPVDLDKEDPEDVAASLPDDSGITE